jgi:hypothetical protein
MRSRTFRRLRQDSPNDVGTLWTLQRADLTARCALFSWQDAWEVCVLIDGKSLTSRRCARTEDAFAVAERWRLNLLAQSWQQIVPRPAAS